MRFIARLVTQRHMERGVQNFAPDRVNAEGMAREWLKNRGQKGDKFEIFDTMPVKVGTVEWKDSETTSSHPASNPGIQKPQITKG